MKKSYLVIIALVGIAVTAGLAFFAMELSNSCIELVKNTDCAPFIVDRSLSVEISELKEVYNWKQPITFTILAHKFSGCSGIHLMIFNEFMTQPPLYEKNIQTECNPDSKIKPREYAFSISVDSLNVTKQGKYYVFASYYVDRGTFGEITKPFVITKMPVLEET